MLGILWLFWLGSVLALVFGYVAKSQIDRSRGRETGRGIAIAGIVLGWVGIAVLALVIVLALVGSTSSSVSGGGSSRATPVSEDRVQVEQVLARYAQATRDKDYQTICDDVYAADLVERVRAAGLPCEVALRTGLEDRQNPRLEVLGVDIDGDSALARVRSTAGGEGTSTDLVRLIREGSDWRVASLSEPGPR